MTTNCPCCGLVIREAAAVCPLCNERLVRVHFRARHVLSGLLLLEMAVILKVLV